MKKLLLFFLCSFLLCRNVLADSYTDAEAHAAWNQLMQKPLTEVNFRAACDLMQGIAQTNIQLSYQLFTQYLPMVTKSGNRQWVHVLLMGWARAKESLHLFEQADSLYQLARLNALAGSHQYNEVLVGMVLTFADGGISDSLKKYTTLGKNLCKQNGDKENLSLLYTFQSVANLTDTASLHHNLDSAIALATGLPDKNALFTARYNYAVFYCRSNPQKQVQILDELLELAKDSSLNHRPRLYERTGFYFRGPAFSVYYQLMQVNLLLTDYENAGKFAELVYEATIKPNPASPQAPYFYAELALIKTYQDDYIQARQYFEKSRAMFALPEEEIPSGSYCLTAGRLAEKEKKYAEALHHYELAVKKGSSYGLHVIQPEIYYAHALILTGQLDKAEQVLAPIRPALQTLLYSATGYYYYSDYAALLKARNDYTGYAHALEIFYQIKDSLNNLNHYRIIQDAETKMRVHDKERQISQLNDENAAKQSELRRQRINLIIFASLAIIIIVLLLAYGRNQYRQKRQASQITKQNEILQQNKIIEMEKQHRINVMQGAIDAEENERHKIADQLHDEVGSMLALASLNISSVLEKGPGHDQSTEKIKKASGILTAASGTIRDISHRLTPLFIEKYHFSKAIEDLDSAVNLSGKLALHTVLVGFEDDKKYPVALLNNLYRIVQELVHNILKHAQATQATLELVEHEHHITLMVEDNGIGIGDLTQAKGKGLDSIRSKIAYLNGRIEIMKKKDGGTLIVIEINV